jgi:hypothetical protein
VRACQWSCQEWNEIHSVRVMDALCIVWSLAKNVSKHRVPYHSHEAVHLTLGYLCTLHAYTPPLAHALWFGMLCRVDVSTAIACATRFESSCWCRTIKRTVWGVAENNAIRVPLRPETPKGSCRLALSSKGV